MLPGLLSVYPLLLYVVTLDIMTATVYVVCVNTMLKPDAYSKFVSGECPSLTMSQR